MQDEVDQLKQQLQETKNREAWYQQILDDHQMERAKLDELTLFMRAEPEWLEETYRSVQEELAKKAAESGREN